MRWTIWIQRAALIVSTLAILAEATQAQSPKKDIAPVRIGVLTDMSGMYRDIMGPGSVTAAQMAVADFGGKVLGRPIEVVSADHQAKPDVGSSIARSWFDTQDVSAIVDVAQSAIALAIQEIARSWHKIVMYGVVGTPAITQEECTATTFSWSLNAHAINAPLPAALITQGLDTFFFVTVDYSFGHAMEAEATKAIKAAGGKVVGSVRFPQHAEDFSSFLLQAQASKAKVLYLISAAADTTTALKQAVEFGIAAGGQRIVVPLTYITNIHALGLASTEGSTFLTPFYWDRTPETRTFAARFQKERGTMPTMDHAAVYSATLHYLRAVAAAKTLDGPTVADEIRKLPVRDFYVSDGKVRADGWLMHDFYLAQVKSPSESEYPWDYYKIVQTIPADEAAQPLSESKCHLNTQ
jgi:branched-chain amino acid transport system substrate-binding protein